MNFKINIKFSVLIITLVNLANGQITITTPRLPLPPPEPTTDPAIQAQVCTQFTNAKEKWITFKNVNNQQSVVNSCFWFPDDYHLVSWHEARDACINRGASLVSIHSQLLNYLLSHRNKYGVDGYSTIYWIGLNSLIKRGQYVWSDGSPRDYVRLSNKTSTGDLIPSNVYDQGRCVSMKSMSMSSSYPKVNLGTWFKENCALYHEFICEKKTDGSAPVTTPPPPVGNCPQGWWQYANRKCIQYVNVSMNYNQSVEQCSKLGGDLLTIQSQEEQDFVTALIAGKNTPYIGFRRLSYYLSWTWVSQAQVTYTNWGLMQSTYNLEKLCAIAVTNSSQPGKWLPTECARKQAAICEKKPDPNVQNPGLTFVQNKCSIPGFDGFVQYRNSCYNFMDSDPNKFAKFSDAENSCKNMGEGAHLVSIVDAFESAFLKYYIKQWGKSDLYWVGLRSVVDPAANVTQMFEWTDDWPVYYSNWDKYEPQFAGQEKCVNFAKSNGTWRINACDATFAYICKTTTNTLPKMNTDRTGVCPHLNGVTDPKLFWVDLDKRNRYCYWFSVDMHSKPNTSLESWSDASFHCRRRNGTLVSIHSNNELMILKPKLTQTVYYNTWIGLYRDPNGLYVWEDGSALDFTDWDPNEKIVKQNTDLNDDSAHQCVESTLYDLKWKQQPCASNKRNYYICGVKKIYAKDTPSPSTVEPTTESSKRSPTSGKPSKVSTTKTPTTGKQDLKSNKKEAKTVLIEEVIIYETEQD